MGRPRDNSPPRPVPPVDAHKFRRGDPDWSLLVRDDRGQITHNFSIRQGCGDTYVELRQWCYENGLNFSDIVNTLLEPLLHFCSNFARRDKEGNVIVTMNFGDVHIQQVYHPRTPRRHSQFEKIDRTHYNKLKQRECRSKARIVPCSF